MLVARSAQHRCSHVCPGIQERHPNVPPARRQVRRQRQFHAWVTTRPISKLLLSVSPNPRRMARHGCRDEQQPIAIELLRSRRRQGIEHVGKAGVGSVPGVIAPTPSNRHCNWQEPARGEEDRALQREWEVTHKGELFDPEWFRANVLPRLATVSLTTIARGTGMSATAAGKIRSGERVPHPRRWEALRACAK